MSLIQFIGGGEAVGELRNKNLLVKKAGVIEKADSFIEARGYQTRSVLSRALLPLRK